MDMVCQPSYPLNSENASPPGTCTAYLACPASWAEVSLPPKTASTETASEATTITTAGIRLRVIALSPFVLIASHCKNENVRMRLGPGGRPQARCHSDDDHGDPRAARLRRRPF